MQYNIDELRSLQMGSPYVLQQLCQYTHVSITDTTLELRVYVLEEHVEAWV